MERTRVASSWLMISLPPRGSTSYPRTGEPPVHLPFLPGGGDLVPRALSDDLPLKLREGKQNVQAEATQRRPRIKLLRDGDEPDAMLVEDLHQPRKIEQGTAEPIHLVE